MRYSILFSFLAIVFLYSCRKDDNPKIPDLTRVPTPLITIDPTSDKLINPGNPAAFKGKVNVGLYFETDIKPQKFDVVVMKNGNKANVKVLKADVTTFPTTVEFTGQELITLFGGPIADGDAFDIGVDITTQSGEKFLAFPAVGNAYGAGVGNQLGASLTVKFLKPCTFVSSAYVGDFSVLQDDWNDYAVGDVIPVKTVSANQISFEYNAAFMDAGTSKPIILTINPATNNITVTKQEYGSYTGDATYFAESVAGPASAVNPCDLSISVRLKHTTAAGFSSERTIRLKKKA
jgi:hypothetical protein